MPQCLSCVPARAPLPVWGALLAPPVRVWFDSTVAESSRRRFNARAAAHQSSPGLTNVTYDTGRNWRHQEAGLPDWRTCFFWSSTATGTIVDRVAREQE